eukprot:6188419-Pleurochrysis_carterae.AAC.5
MCEIAHRAKYLAKPRAGTVSGHLKIACGLASVKHYMRNQMPEHHARGCEPVYFSRSPSSACHPSIELSPSYRGQLSCAQLAKLHGGPSSRSCATVSEVEWASDSSVYQKVLRALIVARAGTRFRLPQEQVGISVLIWLYQTLLALPVAPGWPETRPDLPRFYFNVPILKLLGALDTDFALWLDAFWSASSI